MKHSLASPSHPVSAAACDSGVDTVRDGDQQDDFALLARWREGDHVAGSRLYRRHAASIARFFVSKAPEAAEDLVQQTFLGTLEAVARFRGEASFRTFLFSVARNQLYKYYRDRRVVAGHADAELELPRSYHSSPSSVLARAREHVLLTEAMRVIPLDLRIALELHFWEDLTIPEIAEVLGVPLNTGYSRLRRAKEILREKLQRD